MGTSTRAAVAAAMLLAIGLAVWLRISSLGSMPLPDGDEAWFVIMSSRAWEGRPFETHTPTGNPMWLLQAPVHLPLLLAFGPQLWITRSASSVAGLLAIALCYGRFARLLGRTTAAIAATMLAVSPAAIAASRTGWDISLAPLFGVLMLSSAFRLRAFGVILATAVGYLCHPSTVFALPTAMAVFAARSRTVAAPPWKSRRGLACRFGAMVLTGAAFALMTAARPSARGVLSTYDVGIRGPHDPIRFLALYGRYFLSIGNRPMATREAVLWTVAATVGAVGLRSLIRSKRWDRVALVLGAAATAAALFILGGSNILQPGMVRNGNVLLVPTVLAFSCLLHATLLRPEDDRLRHLRSVQFGAMAAAALALLLSFDVGALDNSKCQDGGVGASSSGESIWTFGPDAVDPRVEALESISASRRDEGSAIIVCDTWMTAWPIAYLCLDRQEIRVIDHGVRPDLGLTALRDGAAALSMPGGELDRTIRSALPSLAMGRQSLMVDDRRAATLYLPGRAGPPRPVVGDFDGDGRDDLAWYDPGTGLWHGPDASGRFEELVGVSLAIPAPGDYDGDGRDEPRMYRPASGEWSEAGRVEPRSLDLPAMPEFHPASGDYDGDGRDEPALYDAVRGDWLVLDRSGATAIVANGHPGCLPIPGDFDGDGRVEPGLFGPEDAVFILGDRGTVLPFGQGIRYGGEPIAASLDLDGDGRDDPAVYQAESGRWVALRSTEGAGSFPARRRGALPIPGDFDGDGRADLAVIDPSTGQLRGGPPVRGRPDLAIPARPTFRGRPRTVTRRSAAFEPPARR